MSDRVTHLPLEQQAIRDKCFHPTGTFVEFKKDEIEQSISERFEKIARMHPERVAVKSENRVMTYAELNCAANRVAHAILSRSHERQLTIAMLLKSGARAIIATYGTLKAGKIYVPLDPSYPPERLALILADSRAAIMVTDSVYLSLALQLGRDIYEIINIDDAPDSTSSSANPEIPISASEAACIYYTSGSTGRPKGVVHSHRSLLHKIMAYTNDLHIVMQDRLSLLYSFSFAASIRHIFSATLNGAALFLFDLNTRGLTNFARWLIQEKVTICHTAASVFRGFAGMLSGAERFPALRVLYVANEPVLKRDVELYRANFSDTCVFVNAFVATEDLTIRQFFLNKETEISGYAVPVGYPVDGEDVVIVDEQGAEVDGNEVGEIAVKSRYAALGYWGQPEMTCAAFRSETGGEDERVYRTGDLGRLLPDGCLMHVGRKDFQVKIRGYRVDVAEIETALLETGKIKDAVVVSRENQVNQQELVAYVVPSRRPEPSVQEIRSFLQHRLPNYMTPSDFVLLPALPRNPNGKVDRNRLPDPQHVVGRVFVPPGNNVEQIIAGVWRDVLCIDGFGIHDNFFDLGGNSLLLGQVQNEVQKIFQQELPIARMFECPTVHTLAKCFNRGTGGALNSENNNQDLEAKKKRDGLARRQLQRQRASRTQD